MSNLSELLPAGAGAKSADFVASGTLGSGVTVALKADGTVEAVASSSAGAGSAVVFESANTEWISSAYDASSNKVVIAYKDGGNSNYGTAIVGTVSGLTISFGAAVVFYSGNTSSTSCVFDSSNNKIVISYREVGTSTAKAIVGTVSGTSISFGTSVTFLAQVATFTSSVFDSLNNKVVIAYKSGATNFGTAIVGTVSGTSISFGSSVTFEAANLDFIAAVFDSNSNKVVLAYRDYGNSFQGTAIVGTVSGTSISFGTSVLFNTASVEYISLAFDSTNNKVVVAYQDEGNSSYGTSKIGTVSGTSISFGSATVFESATTFYTSTTFDSNNDKIVIAYQDQGNSNYGTAVIGTVSGTSISFGSSLLFNSASTGEIASSYDSTNEKTVIFYRDTSSSNHGTSVVFQATASTNSADFIGITDQAIADTATGAVIVQGGVSEKLSGLTVGADYYVQADGSLASGTIPYDISGASFVQNFSVAAQDTAPTGIAFNTDGTKMFVVGFTNDSVYEYALSTGFNVSTASYSQNFSVSAQDTDPEGIAFNTDGTKMYIVGRTGQDINEYTLSTGFDISTATYSQNFSVSAQDTAPTDIAFNADGTKMFVVGRTSDNVNEYTLTTGFDVSTATYSQNFSVASEQTFPEAMAFNTDGTKMFITGQSPATVFVYTLSTGFDVSTAAYSSVSFSVSTQEGTPTGIKFNNDGTTMFIVGRSGDEINEYSTTAASTTVPAGRALSTTSILLEG